MTRPDTQELLRLIGELPSIDSVDELSSHMGSPTFPEALSQIMKERDISVTRLCEAALLSRSFTYQLCEGIRVPGRDIVLRLAIVLELSYEQTQHLLLSAQRGVLYPRVRRDAIIIIALGKHMSLSDTDEALRSLGEEPLI